MPALKYFAAENRAKTAAELAVPQMVLVDTKIAVIDGLLVNYVDRFGVYVRAALIAWRRSVGAPCKIPPQINARCDFEPSIRSYSGDHIMGHPLAALCRRAAVAKMDFAGECSGG